MTCPFISPLSIATRWPALLLALLVLFPNAQPLRAAGAFTRPADPARQALRHGPALPVGGNPWVQKAEFSPSELQHDNQFGGVGALSADGTTVIVTAPYRNVARGTAYVFERN